MRTVTIRANCHSCAYSNDGGAHCTRRYGGDLDAEAWYRHHSDETGRASKGSGQCPSWRISEWLGAEIDPWAEVRWPRGAP